jgi:hypothetical protein
MPLKGSKMSPKHRNAIKRALNRPEVRQKRIESITKAWADPERKLRRSKDVKEQWANPEVRERRVAGMLRVAATPEAAKRKSKVGKKIWSDLSPEQHAARRKNMQAGASNRWKPLAELNAEIAALRVQVEDGNAAAARLQEIEKASEPIPIGENRIAMNKPGPRPDVERATYVCELRDSQGMRWQAILERVEARFGLKTTIAALSELRKSHLGRQKKTK